MRNVKKQNCYTLLCSDVVSWLFYLKELYDNQGNEVEYDVHGRISSGASYDDEGIRVMVNYKFYLRIKSSLFPYI